MHSLWLPHVGVALLDGHGGVLKGNQVEAALLRSLLAGNGGDLGKREKEKGKMGVFRFLNNGEKHKVGTEMRTNSIFFAMLSKMMFQMMFLYFQTCQRLLTLPPK